MNKVTLKLSEDDFYRVIGKLASEYLTNVSMQFDFTPYIRQFAPDTNFADCWWHIQPHIAMKNRFIEFELLTGANLSRKRTMRARIRIEDREVPEMDPEMFGKVTNAIRDLPNSVFNININHTLDFDAKVFFTSLLKSLGLIDSKGNPNHVVMVILLIAAGLSSKRLRNPIAFLTTAYFGYMILNTQVGQKGMSIARELLTAFQAGMFQDEETFFDYISHEITTFTIAKTFGLLRSRVLPKHYDRQDYLYYPRAVYVEDVIVPAGMLCVKFGDYSDHIPKKLWIHCPNDLTRKTSSFVVDWDAMQQCGEYVTKGYYIYRWEMKPQGPDVTGGIASLASLVVTSIAPAESLYIGAPWAKAITSTTTIFSAVYMASEALGKYMREHWSTWEQVCKTTPYGVVQKCYAKWLPYRKYLADASELRFREMCHICELYDETQNLMINYDGNERDKKEVINALSRLVREVTPLYNNCVVAYNDTRDIRVEPVGVFLCGAPGKGKSLLTRLIISKIAEITLPKGRLQQFKDKPTLEIWNYNPAEEHCTYKNEAFITMDDGFQAKAGSELSQKMSLFLIACINTSPYAVHSAELEKKGNVFLRPDGIIINSNVECLESLRKDVSCKEAIIRRLALAYMVSVIPSLATDESLKNSAEPWRYRLDQRKLDEHLGKKGVLVDEGVWVLYAWDLATGKPVSGAGETVAELIQRFEVEHLSRLKKFEATMSMLREFRASGDTSWFKPKEVTLDETLELVKRHSFQSYMPSVQTLAFSITVFITCLFVVNLAVSSWKQESGQVVKKELPKQPSRPKPKWFGKATAQLGANHSNIVSNVVRNNMYVLTEIDSDGKETKFGYVTFVCGRVAMMPYHFYSSFKIENEYKLSRCGGPSTGVSFRSEALGDPIAVWCDYDTRPRDIVFIEFPKIIHEHPKMTKYIPNQSDVTRILKNKGVPITIVRTNQRDILIETGVCDYAPSQPYETMGTFYEGIHYNITTTAGDCGALLWCFIGPKPFLLGIHTAGRGGLGGFGTLLYEDPDYSCVEYLDSLCKIKTVEIDDTPPAVAEMGSNCVVEREERAVFYNTRSCFRKSFLGRLDPPLWNRRSVLAPAMLRRSRDGSIDPWVIARSKYSPLHPYGGDLAQCIVFVIQKINEPIDESTLTMRVLEFDEAVIGVPALEIGSLPRNTSPGFPYIFEREGSSGKTAWFGKGAEYSLTGEKAIEFRKEIDNFESKLRCGIRGYYIFVDHLKDETLPLEKVRTGATRLFSAASMAYIVLQKKFFGTFVNMIAKYKGRNGSAYGINPFSSKEWGMVPVALESGLLDPVVSGDFKRFDKTLPPYMMYGALDVIQWFYKTYDKRALQSDFTVREVLFEDLVNSYHLSNCDDGRGIVYSWMGSNPSGNYLTTTLNILCHMLILYKSNEIVLSRHYGLRGVHLPSVVLMMVYGDDGVWTVKIHKDGRDLFDGDYVAKVVEAMGKLGFTYVDPSGTEAKIVTLSEASFLKRGFVLDANYEWRAPLDLDSICEPVLWVRSGTEEFRVDDFHQNVLTQCREFALHGRTVWEKYVPELIERYNSNQSKYKIIRTFDMDWEDAIKGDYEYLKL